MHLLALTHLSTRYLGREIAAEAVAEFPDTVVPRDFDTVELPLPERDRPHLLRGGERVPATAGSAGVGAGRVTLDFDPLAADYDRLRPAGEAWSELAEHTLARHARAAAGCSTSAAARAASPCSPASGSAARCGASTRRPRCCAGLALGPGAAGSAGSRAPPSGCRSRTAGSTPPTCTWSSTRSRIGAAALREVARVLAPAAGSRSRPSPPSTSSASS